MPRLVPLTVRPAADAAELDARAALPAGAGGPVAAVGPAAIRAGTASGSYRPSWTFLAERGGRVVGRALWWGRPDAPRPASLDCLMVSPEEPDRAAVGAALVAAGTGAFGVGELELLIDVAPGALGTPAADAEIAWRDAAATLGGLPHRTERVSVAWTDATARPPSSGRLRFAPGDDDEFGSLFAAAAAGSLDALTSRVLAERGEAALIAEELAFYRSLPGRDAWRVAFDDAGSAVGFVLPTRAGEAASVGFLGVLPAHRGRRFVDDLIAEAVRSHAAAGESLVVATTDAANAPMRAAFARAGFTETRARIVRSR